MRVSLSLPALMLVAASPARAVDLPIQIDGAYADWLPTAVVATDASGDAGPSGIDFTTLWMANDETRLFLRVDTTVEVQSDEGQSITIAIDGDRDPGTGFPVGPIGAEVVWHLGARAGTEHFGSSSSIAHTDLGLLPAPTVSDTQLELALDRSATPGGMLFPGDSFDLVIFDDEGAGDDIQPVTYTFADASFPVAPITVGRDDPGHLRIAGYNIENDRLFDGGATGAAFDRLFDAIDPDVWVLCEVWDHGASEAADRVEELLPSSGDESWHAVKRDAGNVIVSRLPIIDSWEVLPGARITAALLDTGTEPDLLVVANHFSCCTADENRQEQADALIAFLRDARSPGGEITLPTDTPIVATGDFNLVGLRRQLETLLTGDIADNGAFGPDAPPDWDGSSFDVALGRHPDARLVHTWRNDFSSFYPGRLDWLFFTGSVMTLHESVTVETRSMSTAALAAAGLLAGDTGTASDHAPLVADVTLGVILDAGDAMPAPPSLPAWRPNPFRASVRLDAPGPIDRVEVFDLAGRRVRVLASGERSAIVWDGTDDAGRDVGPGVYFVEMSGPGGTVRARLVRRP